MFDSLTHHAYGIAGQPETIIPKLIKSLLKIGYRTKGNPDFRVESHDVMGVDESRVLKEAAGRKAISGSKKVFIISARGITKEAQNALLKVFEEPPLGTHFFLIVPSLEILLGTLRSRLFAVDAFRINDNKTSSRAETFLDAAVPFRLKIIQGLLKGADEETGKKELLAFMDEIEQSLAAGERRSVADALEEVLKVKKYSRDRAPSFKLLLEHLALVLPKVE